MSYFVCPNCKVEFLLKQVMATAPPVPVASDDSDIDIGALLDSINRDGLDGPSAIFVTETRERFMKYKERTKVSPKQLAWLRKLAAGGRHNTGKAVTISDIQAGLDQITDMDIPF